LHDFEQTKEAEVVTTRRWHMWWLTRLGDYRVRIIRREPKRNWFGTLYYRNIWVLIPRQTRSDHDPNQDDDILSCD